MINNNTSVKTKDTLYRARFKYAKLQDMKYLSQLDITRIIKQILFLVKAPVVIKEGFNPQLKISFGRALPLGIKSICEYFDLFLYQESDLDKMIKDMNKKFPSGLKILKGQYISLKEESIFSSMNTGIFKVAVVLNKDFELVEAKIKNLMINQDKINFTTKNKEKEILLATILRSIDIKNRGKNQAIISLVLKDIIDPKKILAFLNEDIKISNIRCLEFLNT
ncbi:TIGR03936 family radical SAM-associated protein [bacterium]|nr:TIGR03936 family radical SAM-associated protein [bacterium]MBU2599856.1 TIGR03936 family radical SAM-associated protein [bacterium]